jgi:hypothetical protein
MGAEFHHASTRFGLHPMATPDVPNYCQLMNNNNHILKSHRSGLILGALLLVTLAKCVSNAEGQSAVITVNTPVVTPQVVVQDNYVYYPSYGVYYNSSRHEYAYLDAGAWVSRSAPQGVTVEVLLASPSVKMDFHDSPERHHAKMLQQYPKNWAPRDENHREDHDKK